MKKLYCLFFLFFALSVRGEEDSDNVSVKIVNWDREPIVSYGGQQYAVLGRTFEKMRVHGKKKIKYIKTPEEVKVLLRAENARNIKARNENIKKNASSGESNECCIIL